jgi:carbamoyltransferase
MFEKIIYSFRISRSYQELVYNMDKYVLGLNLSHDRSACLLKNGRPIVVIEEERLDRLKHSHLIDNKGILHNLVPFKSIKYCLQKAKIYLDDIDLIIASNATIVFTNKQNKRTNLKPHHISKQLNISKNKIKIINHHLGHAAAVYYTSPFSESTIMINDGTGNKIKNDLYERTTLFEAKNNKIKTIKQILGKKEENSLGAFYKMATRYFLGWEFGQEGKVMGLSAYGTAKLNKTFEKAFTFDEKEPLKIKPQLLFAGFWETKKNYVFKGLERKPGTKMRNIDQDIAFSTQYFTEKAVLHLAKYLSNKTKSKNICLSGGVALNSVANNKLAQSRFFDNIFIMPACGDNGCAIGNALYGWINILKKERKQFPSTAYYGKTYSEKEILDALKQHHLIKYKKIKNIEKHTAKLIANKKIVGWFQGKSEIGPRALGNRSILCDPRDKKMKQILNVKVKHREPFRPFAPSVLEEYSHEFFDTIYSPFMLLVGKVKKPRLVPAITHFDGTARIQTVNKKQNLKYYRLIKEFYKLTKIPVLLNTSFNDKKEPIIETPGDAISCFLSTKMDYLVLGNYLISKEYQKIKFGTKPILTKFQPRNVSKDISILDKHFEPIRLRHIGIVITYENYLNNKDLINKIVNKIKDFKGIPKIIFPLKDIYMHKNNLVKDSNKDLFELSDEIKFYGSKQGYSTGINKSLQLFDFIILISNKKMNQFEDFCQILIPKCDYERFCKQNNKTQKQTNLQKDLLKNLRPLIGIEIQKNRIKIHNNYDDWIKGNNKIFFQKSDLLSSKSITTN